MLSLLALATLNPRNARAQSAKVMSDSVAIVATVERLHSLMIKGDTLGVANLLAPDLTVLESGSIETRAEYLRHHLHSDAEFAKAIPGERRVTSVVQVGDVAWVIAETTAHGIFRDRRVDSRGAELIIVSRFGPEWRIRAIHWSSRRIAP